MLHLSKCKVVVHNSRTLKMALGHRSAMDGTGKSSTGREPVPTVHVDYTLKSGMPFIYAVRHICVCYESRAEFIVGGMEALLPCKGLAEPVTTSLQLFQALDIT